MHKSPLIIGFGYKARRGKDTAVQHIIAERGNMFDIRRYSFGDHVKGEVAGKEAQLCLQYGIPMEPDNKWRSLLQFWGTEHRRKQDPFYWVKKVARAVALDQPQVALISDMRFLNEFAWVTTKGTTVKLERLGFQDLNINTNHASETELDGALFDYEIQVADGDVEELKKDALYVFDLITQSLEPPDLSDIAPAIVITDS